MKIKPRIQNGWAITEDNKFTLELLYAEKWEAKELLEWGSEGGRQHEMLGERLVPVKVLIEERQVKKRKKKCCQ